MVSTLCTRSHIATNIAHKKLTTKTDYVKAPEMVQCQSDIKNNFYIKIVLKNYRQ